MKTTMTMTATTKNDESSRKTGAILADTDSIITDGNTRSTVQKNGASAAPTGRDDGKASILSNGGTVSDGASAAPTAVTSGKKRKMDDGAAADDDDDNNGDRPVKKKRWCTEIVFHRGVSKSTVMAGGAAPKLGFKPVAPSTADAVRVPAVLAVGLGAGRAYLALEWIDLQPGSSRAEAWRGERLAAQHRLAPGLRPRHRPLLERLDRARHRLYPVPQHHARP